MEPPTGNPRTDEHERIALADAAAVEAIAGALRPHALHVLRRGLDARRIGVALHQRHVGEVVDDDPVERRKGRLLPGGRCAVPVRGVTRRGVAVVRIIITGSPTRPRRSR